MKLLTVFIHYTRIQYKTIKHTQYRLTMKLKGMDVCGTYLFYFIIYLL